MPLSMAAPELDHLVVAARTLEQGAAWCEATFGVAPGAGGQHAFMGTHNRLLDISSTRHPRAYLEIIAIDPALPDPARRRWFGLDDAAMQERIAASPQLVHWVARVDAIDAAPALIQWTGAHPTDTLPASGVRLVALTTAPQRLGAVLDGPLGRVTLHAPISTPIP